jgi:hypothetical protein
MDPRHIIDVCEANWDAHRSDCSGFVKAVAAALAVQTFTDVDNADAIVDKLRAAASWTPLRSGDGTEAKAMADAGQFVIGGLKGSDQLNPDQHGHVVVVVTGPLDSSHGEYPTAYWGKLGSIGAKAKAINFAWRAVDRDHVGYFAKSLDAATPAPDPGRSGGSQP